MLKNRFDIITIGGATKDFFIFFDKGLIIKNRKNLLQQELLAFEYGAKNYIDNFYSSIGGGACNASVGFSRLGLKSAARICVNKKKHGKLISEALRKEGVNISLIENNNKEESGLSFILVNLKSDSRDHTVFSYRGSNKYLKINPKEKWNADWIFLSSFSGANWQREFKNVIEIVKKNRIKLAFNPGFRQILSGLKKLKDILAATEVLIVNRNEAVELISSQYHYKRAPSVKDLFNKLYFYCPHLIVITDGIKGAYAYDGDKIYFQKAKKVKSADTLGAGDAFSSGFVSGLIKYDYNIKKSLNLGIRNGASVVQKVGAQQGLLRLKL
ncbi:carbohydrate kinase family protein [Candidatus Parcubacteria bacterium]|nr:carbohydrate kinase family protein [Candidatus Parcubacteria bacterium]